MSVGVHAGLFELELNVFMTPSIYIKLYTKSQLFDGDSIMVRCLRGTMPYALKGNRLETYAA